MSLPISETTSAMLWVAFAVGCAQMVLVIGRMSVFAMIAMVCLPWRSTRRVPHPITAFDEQRLPKVLVVIPAHNEAAVITHCLTAIDALEYPNGKLDAIVINDRSSDATGVIIDEFIAQRPQSRIRAVHRDPQATPGKSAAIKEACDNTDAEILVFFDADYLPRPELVRRLIAPFADIRVASTMGRVVPVNADASLLTRLIDLERRGGYAVDLEMRQRLGLLPQFGGTVGAIRRSALNAVGGWRSGLLAEDTDMTYRFFLADLNVVYLNDAECYEEVPETWSARYKQVRRWSYGHNQCMAEYFLPVLTKPGISPLVRIDALLVLTFFLMPFLFAVSSIAAFGLIAMGNATALIFVGVSLFFLIGFGNMAPFMTIFVAALKDEQPEVLRYLPALFISSAITAVASIHGILQLIFDRTFGLNRGWEKTPRFRVDSNATSSLRRGAPH